MGIISTLGVTMPLLDLSRTIYAGMPKIPFLPEVEFHPILRVTSDDDGRYGESSTTVIVQ